MASYPDALNNTRNWFRPSIPTLGVQVGAARSSVLLVLVLVVVAGAIWAYRGGSLSEAPDTATETAGEMATATGATGDAVSDMAGDAGDAVSDMAGNAGDAVSDMAGDAGDAVSDMAGDAGDAVSDMAGNAGDAVSGMAGNAGDAMSDMAGNAGDAMSDMAGDASDALSELVDETITSDGRPTGAEPGTPVESDLTEVIPVDSTIAADEILEAAAEVAEQAEAETAEAVPDALPEEPAAEAVDQAEAETAPEADVETPVVDAGPATEAAPVETSAGAETVTVEPGDYLARIAKRVYGDSSKWELLYNANRDQLSSPDALQVGMELQVPAAQ